MTTNAVERANSLRLQARELLDQADNLDSYGLNEDFDIGDILVFKKRFKTNGGKIRGVAPQPTYTYVALKAGADKWYVTGQSTILTFDQLFAHIEWRAQDFTREIVVELETV